jgi:hypothetical protein
MSVVGHVHDYKDKRFVDQCHYVEIVKTCKGCGAVHKDVSIRDFALNPLQVAFARQDCPRCRSMLTARNLEPASWAHV